MKIIKYILKQRTDQIHRQKIHQSKGLHVNYRLRLFLILYRHIEGDNTIQVKSLVRYRNDGH